MKTNRYSALIAGIGLILMAIVAGFSYGYAHNSIVEMADPEATINNLRFSAQLFNMEIIGWIIILLLDITVAWALYLFFKKENNKISLSTAIIRLIYSAILGVAIFNLIQIQSILNGIHLMNQSVLNMKVMSNLSAFEKWWSLGLIVFGFHLLGLGYLALTSKNIHWFWGVMLVIAAISYIAIHSAYNIFLNFEGQVKMIETILIIPMTFGEIGFAFWLVIRGGKSRK